MNLAIMSIAKASMKIDMSRRRMWDTKVSFRRSVGGIPDEHAQKMVLEDDKIHAKAERNRAHCGPIVSS